MNFTDDFVPNQTPQLMNMWLLPINTLNESSGLSKSATRILRPMHGSDWIATDHVFGKVTAVGMIEEKSDHDY